MDPVETISAIMDTLIQSQHDISSEQLKKAKRDILSVMVSHQIREYSVENILF